MEEGRLIGHIIAVGVGVIFALLPAKIRTILAGISFISAIGLLLFNIVMGEEWIPFMEILIIATTIFSLSISDYIDQIKEKRKKETLAFPDSWTDSWYYGETLYRAILKHTETGVLFHTYEKIEEEDLFPPLTHPADARCLEEEEDDLVAEPLPRIPTPVTIRPPSRPFYLREAWIELENKYGDDID